MTSEEIFRSLMLVGDRDTAHLYHQLQEAGFNLPRDADLAVQSSHKRASDGDPAGMYALAVFHKIGLSVPNDKVVAKDWCQKSALLDFAPALLMLADFYESGWAGLDQDPQKAVELRERAAKLGYAPAIAALAVMRETGKILAKDRKLALDLFGEASELGDAYSQCQLGYLLLNTPGLGRQSEAIAWLQEAAAQDNADAHRHLANYYSAGRFGLPRDAQRAQFHRERAEAVENRWTPQGLP